jgi:hypothetical protein
MVNAGLKRICILMPDTGQSKIAFLSFDEKFFQARKSIFYYYYVSYNSK